MWLSRFLSFLFFLSAFELQTLCTLLGCLACKLQKLRLPYVLCINTDRWTIITWAHQCERIHRKYEIARPCCAQGTRTSSISINIKCIKCVYGSSVSIHGVYNIDNNKYILFG